MYRRDKERSEKGETDQLSKIRRKTIEYSIVTLATVGTMALVKNYKHSRNQNESGKFNMVQNIDNKVFVDRVRLSGGLSGVIVATATDGCPYTMMLSNPDHIRKFSQQQKKEVIGEIEKVVEECGKAIGTKATPHIEGKPSETEAKRVSLRTDPGMR
jgi:hypothetical protein